MFGTIRKHQQWLWVIIIAGVIFSFVIFFGPAQPSLSDLTGGGESFGTLNGKPLTRETLGGFARQAQLAGRLRFGDQMDSPQVRQMGFDLNREMYQRLFLDSKVKEFGVHVSDQAVANWIRQNLKDPKTGAVDYDGFIERFGKRFNFSEAEFQNHVRHELGVEHLREVVGVSGQLLTPRDAEAAFRKENELAVASAVFFSASNHLASVVVDPAALSQFFTNRIAAYRIPERTVVTSVRWDAAPHATEAEAEIKKQADFATRVEEVYNQRGAESFRDKTGAQMTKEAALADIRQLATDSKALEIAARAARDFANELYAMEPAKAENLAALAAKRGLTATESQPFSDFGRAAEFEDAPEMVREAAKLSAEQPFTKPVPGAKSVHIAALRRKLPSEVPSFEAVRAKVTEDFRRSKSIEAARASGETFATAATAAISQGKSFAAVATEQKSVAVEIPPFSIVSTSLSGLDARVAASLVKDTAFNLKPGAASRFVASGDGGFVIFLKERRPVDEATVKAGLTGYLDTQRRQKQDEAFQEWFRQEFQKSGLAALLKNRDEQL